MQILFYLGLAMATAGFVFVLLPTNDTDPYFQANIRKASYSGRNRPVVLIDEAHSNGYTIEGRFQPLARLLREDGYIVGPNLRLFTRDSLRGIAVLIIGNARGFLFGRAFRSGEAKNIGDWVRSGGNLLLAADAGVSSEASQALAAEFGVSLTNRRVKDTVLFTRLDGTVLRHPVTDGRIRMEQVDQVMSFGGQALRGSPAGTVFLKLPEVEENLSQGFALESGRGRAVILGNCAMITAQRASLGGRDVLVGMNRGGNDNARLVLNMLHWLSRL